MLPASEGLKQNLPETAVSKETFDNDNKIAGTHYLYHGRASKIVRDQVVDFYVIEHTTFVDLDHEDFLPHGRKLASYVDRATDKPRIPESGKSDCLSPLGILSCPKMPKEPFVNGVNGYVFVLDCTAVQKVVDRQMKLLKDVVEKCRKQAKPIAVVLTKRDHFDYKFTKLHPKQKAYLEKLVCFEVSAKEGIGVDAPFFYLHQLAPKAGRLKKLPDYDAQLELSARAERRAWEEICSALWKEAAGVHAKWMEMVEKIRRSPALAALAFYGGTEAIDEFARVQGRAVQVLAKQLTDLCRTSADIDGDITRAASQNKTIR